ncbi:MAG: hypothetical protein DRR19_19840 [Candidatus Parabeggiatoa sp. nov. 1]|nr:MAG: hypothetical protein DRR19_19840 [Gammaproteobacteria bacterium]
MKFLKIFGLAVLNTTFALGLLYALWIPLYDYTGRFLNQIDFSSFITYGVLFAIVILVCFTESRITRLPLWGVLVTTVTVFSVVAGLIMAAFIMLAVASF